MPHAEVVLRELQPGRKLCEFEAIDHFKVAVASPEQSIVSITQP